MSSGGAVWADVWCEKLSPASPIDLDWFRRRRKDMQSKGVGTALLEAVIDRGKDHWGLRRLGLVVWAYNSPAIRLYEKHGFEHEGQFKDYVRSGASFKNALAMARLFPEN